MHGFPSTALHGPLVHEVATVFYRTVVLYVVALLVLRLTGKRALGKMNAFDFVVAVTFGSAVAIGMEADNKFLPAVVPVVMLGVLQWGMARLNLGLPALEGWTRGEAVALVKDGRRDDGKLRGERITEQELAMELRQKGYARVQEVAEATLETTGQISVLPTREARPLTRQDLDALARAVAEEVIRQQKGAQGDAEKHKA